MSDTITGFCQNCEKDVQGEVVREYHGKGSIVGAKTWLIISNDRQCHKVVETVTQRILTKSELHNRDAKYKYLREHAEEIALEEAAEKVIEERCKTWVLSRLYHPQPEVESKEYADG